MTATFDLKPLQKIMKTFPRTLPADPVDTASAEAREQMQSLAAQRMCEFLDSLPREPADPSAPPLTRKEISALIRDMEKNE